MFENEDNDLDKTLPYCAFVCDIQPDMKRVKQDILIMKTINHTDLHMAH